MKTFTIISRWPMPLTEERPRQKPRKTFTIPAAPADGFSTMEVTQQTENCYVAAGQHMELVIEAQESTNDLVQAFGKLTCGNEGMIGVWAVEGRPTDEEILNSEQFRQAGVNQEALMQNLVREARALHKDNGGKGICEKHHVAAKYLKIEGDEWQGSTMTRAATQECPFCKTYVPSGAVICPKCTNIIDAAGHVRLKRAMEAQINAIEQQSTLPSDNGGSALRPALKPATAVKKELVPA